MSSQALILNTRSPKDTTFLGPRGLTAHSGGNDRFCARLKTDISASNSGLRGRTRSYLTFLERGCRDESKMVRHDLRWPWRPELKAEMYVLNLAQTRSFPPLCSSCESFRSNLSKRDKEYIILWLYVASPLPPKKKNTVWGWLGPITFKTVFCKLSKVRVIIIHTGYPITHGIHCKKSVKTKLGKITI
jgi:hypothetical protein